MTLRLPFASSAVALSVAVAACGNGDANPDPGGRAGTGGSGLAGQGGRSAAGGGNGGAAAGAAAVGGGAGSGAGGSTPTGGASGAPNGGAGSGGMPQGGTPAGGSSGAGGESGGGVAGIAGASGATAGGMAGMAGASGAGGVAGRGGRGGAGAGGTSGSAGTSGAGGGASDILGATPPMGWNSWNTFQCSISESLIKGVADTMVSSGMQAAGYDYVNLDDCWMDGRDGSGNLRWNTSKFPAGIPALADYVHGKGLKFGIYESANTATCVGLYGGIDKAVAVGSLGNEAKDAATFASWGVNFLKYDLCAGQRSSLVTMGTALRAGTRPILYSINPGNGQTDLDPPKPNWDMQGVANIWRIGFDINASFGSVTQLIDENSGLYSYAGPGHFNDPDMLEVGKLANVNEDRSHFAMWAIMAAPLIAGNDIRSMSTTTRDILTNTEIIAVDQDPLGLQGRRVSASGATLDVWSKTLSGTNVRAVALLNRGGSAASISVNWTDLGLPAGAATVRDLWAHTDLGSFTGSYTASNVPSHGVAMLKVTSAP